MQASYLQRLSDTVGVSVVTVPTLHGEIAANAELCRSLQLSGFVLPHAQWHLNYTVVSVDSGLVISDCYGNIFYDAGASRSTARDGNSLPQFQLDQVQAAATDELVRTFSKYERKHASAWNAMLRTGSITGAPQTAP